MSNCVMIGCAEKLPPNARCKTCANCRASMRHAEAKGVAYTLERHRRLTKYCARMDNIRGKRRRVW